MPKCLKRLLFSVATLVSLTFLSVPLHAQFGIGVSYERKAPDNNLDGIPQSGIGFRIENGFGPKIPAFKLGYRLHASFFSEENDFSDQLGSLTNSDTKFTSDVYDFGAAVLGELKIPFIANPYVGLGIGYEFQNIAGIDADAPSLADRLQQLEQSSLFYNAFIGVKFSPIPVIRPFVEYRYTGFTDLEAITDSPRRLQFGILLEF